MNSTATNRTPQPRAASGFILPAMNTVIGNRLDRHDIGNLTVMGLHAAVYARSGCDTKTNHKDGTQLLREHQVAIRAAKLKPAAKVVMLTGLNYVRAYSIDAIDAKGDVCESKFASGNTARFSLADLRKIAATGAAKVAVQIVTRAEAQAFLDNPKTWSTYAKCNDDANRAGKTCAVALHDFAAAGLTRLTK